MDDRKGSTVAAAGLSKATVGHARSVRVRVLGQALGVGVGVGGVAGQAQKRKALGT